MTSQEPGPFDNILREEPRSPRSDRNASYLLIAMVVLGLLLLVLVLPPISILSGGGDGNGGEAAIKAEPRAEMPVLPEGTEAISPLYDISSSSEVKGPTVITLQLPETNSNPRNLALYTHDGGGWEKIAVATLVLGGAAVRSEVERLPKTVAVLRSAGSVYQVSGWLSPGRELHSDAATTLSLLNPTGLSPAADGTLSGSVASFPEGQAYQVYPSIRVQTQEQADAANAIMASPDLRNQHINAVLEAVESGAYDGVDIDYGWVDPLRKDDFSEFVGALAEQLHRRGLGLTVTAPLPEEEGTSWDTGAYDWIKLGQSADAIKLMPEADPSRYYRRMEQTIEYLTQQVPSTKLVLVLSPWAHEKGGEGIRALGLLEALAIAATVKTDTLEVAPGQEIDVVGESVNTDDGASGILWDEEALAVSYTYPGLGGARTIWIENSFSFGFRLQLAARFELGGVAIEDASTGPGSGDIWPALLESASMGRPQVVRPNGELFVPQWEADGGEFLEGGDASVVWKAPETPGSYHVTLIVSDGMVRVGQRLTITVKQ